MLIEILKEFMDVRYDYDRRTRVGDLPDGPVIPREEWDMIRDTGGPKV